MTTKFTPGPWWANAVFIAQKACHAICFNEYRINPPIFSGRSIDTGSTTQVSREEATANAHLIAAAPDLFTIVERFRRYHDGVAQCDSAEQVQTCRCAVCDDAELVLAKARGDL